MPMNSHLLVHLRAETKFKEGFVMQQFKNGDRVVFLGDSIIGCSRIATLTAECYHRLFPERKVHFFNCGAAGGDTGFGLKILEEDVFACNPTHVIVAYGTNDSWRWCLSDHRHKERYELLKEKYFLFKENLQKLCKKITEKGINLILCTPLPYDEYGATETSALKGGYALLSEFANTVREVARNYNIPLCDIYEGIVEMMQNQDDNIFSSDRIHPTEHGGYLMAKIFMYSQGIDIGEEKPLPQYIKAWHLAVTDFRKLYTAECMLKLGADKPIPERLKKAKEIYENPNTSDWYLSLSKNYLENKENQADIFNTITKLYQKTVLEQEL